MRIRLVIMGLTLALAASGPLAATAQTPVMAPPLAPGEVLLEVNAAALVTTRADRATMTFTVTGSGETEAAARTATQQSIAEIRAMLRTQGVTDADIRVQPISVYQIESMDMAMTNATMTMDEAAADMNATAVTMNAAETAAPVSAWV